MSLKFFLLQFDKRVAKGPFKGTGTHSFDSQFDPNVRRVGIHIQGGRGHHF